MSDDSNIESRPPYDPNVNPLQRPHYDPIPPSEEELRSINDVLEEKIQGCIDTRPILKRMQEESAKSKETEGTNAESKDKEERKTEQEVQKEPLLEEHVEIEIEPEDKQGKTATLPLPERIPKSKEDSDINGEENKFLRYMFPVTRIKKAWSDSSNIFQFFGRAFCIIFQTVGWFTCVGGIPFLSLAMLIIGSIYKNDCNIEPNIPVYLIVSGVLGTIQHFVAVWVKFVPKEKKGKIKLYKSYCNVFNGLVQMFLVVWFIIGAIWVYSSFSDVNYHDRYKKEYCHKTLYLFTFWIFNFSFVIIGLICALSLCFILCLLMVPKES